MKNKLTDLNNHLFAQIERLSDESLPADKLDQENRRAEAMVAVSDQIIRTAALQMQAAKMVTDFDGSDPRPYLSQMRDVTPSVTALGERALAVESRK